MARPNTRNVPAGWYAILAASVALMPVEAFFSFALWFTPGWANGWPFSKHVVWSAGMAILLFAALMTGTLAVGAAYAIARHPARTRSSTRKAFATWVAGSGAVIALLCACVGHALYLGIVRAWP